MPSCTIPQLSRLLTTLPSSSNLISYNQDGQLPTHIDSTMYAAAVAHLKILVKAMLQTQTSDQDLSSQEKDDEMEPWVATRLRARLSSRDPVQVNEGQAPEEVAHLWVQSAGRSRGALLRHAVRVMITCKKEGGMNDQELVVAIQALFAASFDGPRDLSSSFAASALERMGLESGLEVVQTCATEGSEVARSVKRGMARAVLVLNLPPGTAPHLLAQLLEVYAKEACALSESFEANKGSDLLLAMKVVQKLVGGFIGLRGEGTDLSDASGFISALNQAIRAASSYSTLPVASGSEFDLAQLMKDLDTFSH